MNYGQYYPYSAPYPDYNARLNQLMAEQQQQQQYSPGQPQSMYNPYNQSQTIPQVAGNQIRQQPFECRPVTAIDEVRAMQPDFTGKPLFFYNAAANEVYIKQLDMNTGSSFVKTFSLVQPEPVSNISQNPITPQNSESNAEYVSKNEFDGFKQQINSAIGELKDEFISIHPSNIQQTEPRKIVIPESAPNAIKQKE